MAALVLEHLADPLSLKTCLFENTLIADMFAEAAHRSGSLPIPKRPPGFAFHSKPPGSALIKPSENIPVINLNLKRWKKKKEKKRKKKK